MVFFPFFSECDALIIQACLQELVDDPMIDDDELGISLACVDNVVMAKLVEIFTQPHINFKTISLNDCNGYKLSELIRFILASTQVETLYLDKCDMLTATLLSALTVGLSNNTSLKELWIATAHPFDSQNDTDAFRAFVSSLAKISPYLKVIELNGFDLTMANLQEDFAAALFPTESDLARFAAADEAREAAAQAAREAERAAQLAARQRATAAAMAQVTAERDEEQENDAMVFTEVDHATSGDQPVDGAEASTTEISGIKVTYTATDMDDVNTTFKSDHLKSSVNQEELEEEEKNVDETMASVMEAPNNEFSKTDEDAMSVDDGHEMLPKDAGLSMDDPEYMEDVSKQPAVVVLDRKPLPWERIFIGNTGDSISHCNPTPLLTRLANNIAHTRLHWLNMNGHSFNTNDMSLLTQILVQSNIVRLSMQSCVVAPDAWVPFFERVHEMPKLTRADFGRQPQNFDTAVWEALQRALIGGESRLPCVSLGYIGKLPSMPSLPDDEEEEEEGNGNDDDSDDDDDDERTAHQQDRQAILVKRQLYQDVFGRLDMNRLGCTRSQTTMSADEWATVLSRLVHNLDHGYFFLRRDPSMWSHGAVVLQQTAA